MRSITLLTFLFVSCQSHVVYCEDQPNVTVELDLKIIPDFIQDNCQICHGEVAQKGELRLDNFSLQIDGAAATRQWQAVLDAIESGVMPPKDAFQPSMEERAAVVSHLRSNLKQAMAKFGPGYQYKMDNIAVPAASADEPKVESFGQDSIHAAAKYLDNGAIAWT